MELWRVEIRPPSWFEKAFVVVALLLYTNALLPLIRQGDGIRGIRNPDGDTFIQFAFIGLFAVSLIFIIRQLPQVIGVIFDSKFLLLFLFILGISVLWSLSIPLSLRRLAGVLMPTLFAGYLATRYTLRQQLELVAIALGLAAVLSIVFAVGLPSYGLETIGSNVGAWRGIYHQKNVLGRIMALGAVVGLLFVLQGRRRMFFGACLTGLALFLVIQSNSKSALVSVAACVPLILIYRSMRLNSLLAGSVIILVSVVIAVALMAVFLQLDSILVVLDKDITLTGRTELWNALFQVHQRPLIGYGYASFWSSVNGPYGDLFALLNWTPTHAHNGFVEIYVHLGLLGTGVFSMWILATLVGGVRYLMHNRSKEGYWPITYLAFILLVSFTQSIFIQTNSIYWILLVAVSVTVAREFRQARQLRYAVTMPQSYASRI